MCSTPPRDSAADHDAIWTRLGNGTFTVLSSDHCSFMYEDAEKGKKSIFSVEFPEGKLSRIPNGCLGIETRLALTPSADRLPAQRFVEVTSTNAARLYGLYPRKGSIPPGVSDTDLTVWNPPNGMGIKLTNGMLHHNVDYTPFEW